MFPTRRQQKLANKEASDAIRQKNPLPPAAVSAVQCDNGCGKERRSGFYEHPELSLFISDNIKTAGDWDN